MKIAIYGLGIETKKNILDLGTQYEIVGLLDGFQTNGELYGYPIISIKEAVEKNVEKIIVIARPGSCKAIAKRIGELCESKGILLEDIRGKNLLKHARIVYDFQGYRGYTYADVKERIEAYDVISFDLFDTLVLRKLYIYTDIFNLMEEQLKETVGIDISDFAKKRIAAEKELSRNGKAPTLKEIYFHIFKDNVIADRMADREFKIDLSVLRPREDMVKVMNEARMAGKKICITSDTYYSVNQIQEILTRCSIAAPELLMLSCVYSESKNGKLYELLKDNLGNRSVLHIGDDSVSDVENASEHGIDNFHIYSSSELFDMTGGLGLEQYTNSLDGRIRIGLFIAELFNSPFQFEEEHRKICVDNAGKIGYIFCAPMIIDFVLWFIDITKEDRFSNVWFSARDGYLIKKIYEMLGAEKKSEYFLTSRISAIRAGVVTEHDVQYIEEMKFSGSVEENLKCRFGLDMGVISPSNNEADGILKYTGAILDLAKRKRKNTQKYIEKLNIGKDDIAFFDFVAKGTNQMYIQRLVDNHMCGLYFLQLEPQYMEDKKLEIIPFYTEGERSDSVIFDDYYILETILTSPDSSLEDFDGEGNPIFSKEVRTTEDIECFLKVQEGILNYTRDLLAIWPIEKWTINKKMDETFLQLIHAVEIKDESFLNLTVEDTFFNRMTPITTVI